MIPQHEIEEVLSRVDMAEVASDFLTLKKSGSGFMCNCPFHQEKTPSFHIYPARNIYKCFGCGKGGGVVSFLKEKEGMSF
ncbi:MAG: DNA primase, partial [Paludibacteraceae bacterium]|nr:DNA primase [Paludibacteraceae bacterium]